jgi:hypothetical protein
VAGSPGFLRTIKTTEVAAIEASFVATYPETDPQGGEQPVFCSLDYPVDPQKIPSVWVDFETTMLQVARVNRWRFQGNATFTVVALSNNERDLIFDELVSMIAFSAQSESPNSFRAFIDGGGLIQSTWSFDKIEMRGKGEAPGTPWGTDEVIYEQGLSIQVIGEFVSSPVTLALVPLREIIVTAISELDGSLTTIVTPPVSPERFGL